MEAKNYLKECRLLGLKDEKFGNSILCRNEARTHTVDICFDNNKHKDEPVYVTIIGEKNKEYNRIQKALQ